MAGVKGRSGRRPRGSEEWKQRIIDKAWKVLKANLEDDTLSNIEKNDIAKLVVGKDISRNQNVKVTPDMKYITNTPRPAIETQPIEIQPISVTHTADTEHDKPDTKPGPSTDTEPSPLQV